MCKRQKSVPNQKINTLMRLVTCQSDFDTHNSSNSVWLTPKLINPIWFIAMGQKQDRKYQNQEMSTFFFCPWLRTGKFAKIKIVCKQQKIINNEGKRVFEANWATFSG